MAAVQGWIDEVYSIQKIVKNDNWQLQVIQNHNQIWS